MSKMFATVYFTNGKNQKEKEVNEWLRNEIDGTLLADLEAYDKLCHICIKKAAELNSKYRRTHPLVVVSNRDWGFPYHIRIGSSGQINVVEVKHELSGKEGVA